MFRFFVYSLDIFLYFFCPRKISGGGACLFPLISLNYSGDILRGGSRSFPRGFVVVIILVCRVRTIGGYA